MALQNGPGSPHPLKQVPKPVTFQKKRNFMWCLRKPAHIFRASVVLIALFVCTAFTYSHAQGSGDTDNVHIVPRMEPQPLKSVESDAASPHNRPLKVDVDLVLVPVTITDPMNRLVTGLDKENFELFEGKDQQEIKNFSSEDAPVSIGVIFDMSGSMSTKIDRAREAVGEFFKTANPQDEFFMITFADQPQEVSDFTSSVEDIQGKLIYTVPKGRTALLDAIYLGVSKMRQAKYPKKAILIISDGGDNHSRYTEGEIKSLVKESDLLIYAIGIYDHYFPTEEERLGPVLLGDIAELPEDAPSPSTIPMTWQTLLQKLGSSYATNMCLDTVQTNLDMTASGVR